MDIFEKPDLAYQTESHMGRQDLQTKRKIESTDLREELFDRYARGGTGFARFRASFYFGLKKYSWIVVIKSTFFVKRSLDITVSILMLILLSPLFLLTAVAIKLEDPGPVIFSQTRAGRWARPFTIYKFRSMYVGADKMKSELMDKNEAGEILFKIKNDPRITRVGKVIRKLSIDELPQIWNVLKGDMSLVGPRPPVFEEVAQYSYSDRRRLDTKPGITCISQVKGRSQIAFKNQVELDVLYIESQSFWTDMKLLFQTIPAVLLGRGAY
jgi:lipopolysaccharide/colanic/teichoic acid biosynthesis glycosyltransferase